jgi:uncharacterized protein involved in type VI secretion and phage assembly
MDDGSQRVPAERAVSRSLIDRSGVGRPLSRRSMQRQRSVEAYLRGEVLPRYMQRAAQIEQLTHMHAQELRTAYRDLHAHHAGDDAALQETWSTVVAAWDFEEVNTLIRQHNDWYPIERDLPMDPRTGDYVLVSGHTYRREALGPEWADAIGRAPIGDPPR